MRTLPARPPVDGGRALAATAGLLALSAALAWLLAGIVGAAMSQNLLFDGAMNLEVSRSLSEGLGPRRLYDSADLFPAGVQTKEPYVLLGAAVFKLFGVGPFQAQLPNLLYVLLFAAVLVYAVRRLAGTAAGVLAGVLALSLPWMWQYALNGYGEIPSFAYGFTALAVVAWPGLLSRRTLAKCALAGVLAGLALATKTVGLVQIGGAGLVLLLRVASGSDRPWRDLPRMLGVFLAAMLLPLALVEFWRWTWLGTKGFHDWWAFQLSRILYQAGMAPGTNPAPAVPIGAKVATHFGILARELGVSRFVAGLVLCAPLAAAAITHWRRDRASKWLVCGLAAIAVAYAVWWLGITPTEKAWLRRIYVGLLCLSTIAAIAAVAAAREMAGPARLPAKAAHALVLVALAVAFAPFAWRAIRQPVSFVPSRAVVRTLRATDYLAHLPPEARILAYGWYSAPTLALYSGRHFIDFTDWPTGDLVGAPAYLVADRATVDTRALAPLLARYPHEQALEDNIDAQVYAIDLARPRDPFDATQRAAAAASADFGKGAAYSATYGMEPFDPSMGGRWIATDSEILLRYEGQEALVLRGYMALPGYYRFDRPLSGRIVIEGCQGLPFAFARAGWQEFRIPLSCAIPRDSVVRVRILLYNAFDLPRLFERQRSLLLQRIGFGSAA